MLIGATDIGGHDLQDYAMRSVLTAKWVGLALGHSQLGVGNRLDLNLTRFYVCNTTISRHVSFSFAKLLAALRMKLKTLLRPPRRRHGLGRPTRRSRQRPRRLFHLVSGECLRQRS